MPPARVVIKHKQGIPEEGSVRYRPLQKDHPFYDEPCPECNKPLGNGDKVRLRAHFKPSELDVEASYKWKSNMWFTAPAQVIHDECSIRRASTDHPTTVSVVRAREQ